MTATLPNDGHQARRANNAGFVNRSANPALPAVGPRSRTPSLIARQTAKPLHECEISLTDTFLAGQILTPKGRTREWSGLWTSVAK